MKEMLSKYFSRAEVACRCCGKVGPYPENLKRLLAAADKMRELAGKPVIINPNHCIYRCPEHNAAVGGEVNPPSFHTQDLAMDFHIEGLTLYQMAALAQKAGFMGIGIYIGKGFVHADLGTSYPRRWVE